MKMFIRNLTLQLIAFTSSKRSVSFVSLGYTNLFLLDFLVIPNFVQTEKTLRLAVAQAL